MIIDYVLGRKNMEVFGDVHNTMQFMYHLECKYKRTEDKYVFNILQAMRHGTNKDVQKALCDCIDRYNNGNPIAKDYVNKKWWK